MSFTIQYLDADENPVTVPSQATYTVLDGKLRLVRGGRIQRKVGRDWVDIPSPPT